MGRGRRVRADPWQASDPPPQPHRLPVERRVSHLSGCREDVLGARFTTRGTMAHKFRIETLPRPGRWWQAGVNQEYTRV